MNKVLIIEDRSARKEQFLDEELKKELKEMSDFVIFLEGEKYTILKNQLNQDNLSELDSYSVIISHRSAFDHSILDKIKEYCSSTGKPLVFFSGGISSSYFDESKFQFLTINSKEFYSANLLSFLNKIKMENEIETPIIQYGKNWELNYLMEVRNSLANYLYANPSATQITRNVIENDIKLTGRILKILKNKIENISDLTEGIKENGFIQLNKVLESINEEINENIRQL